MIRSISAQEIMTRDVQTCGPDEPLSTAAQLMRQHHCGCVPVVDADGRPLAMVTDRDICMAAEVADKPLSALHIRDAMSAAMHACRTDDSLAVVERTMREHRVHRLPVVDPDGHVVGLLSVSDLAREAARKHVVGARAASAEGVTQTLAGIVERPSWDRDTGRSSRYAPHVDASAAKRS